MAGTTTVTALAAFGVALLMSGASQAGLAPSVQKDVREFQAFFTKAFPNIPLTAYNDGQYVMPDAHAQRSSWTAQMEFPPYELDLDAARALWKAPLRSGKTYAACFKGKPPAHKYPYFDEARKEIRTVELDIIECREANGEQPYPNAAGREMALLVLAFREQFNGKKMAVDVETPGAIEAYNTGKRLYWTKRGQLNFACANCHVGNANKRLRGELLGAGLGQTTGFPAYRTKNLNTAIGPWNTVHRRYQGCDDQFRAAPFPAQHPVYRALEFYQAVNNTGIPVKVPSLRS
jgi:sulfur-oxidizing protein SoxA